MRKELQQGRASTTYSQTSLEDQIEEAATLKTANDLAWKSKDAIELTKWFGKVLKERHWEDVPVNRFFEELEKVFPRFYNLALSHKTKCFVMRRATPTCTETNNLGKFIKPVRDLQMETLQTPSAPSVGVGQASWRRRKQPQPSWIFGPSLPKLKTLNQTTIQNWPTQSLYNTSGCIHCTRTFVMLWYRPRWVRYAERWQFSTPHFKLHYD